MKIVCYGDSNTYGWDPSYFSRNRYDHPWPELLAGMTGHIIINCGEPGRVVPYREELLQWFCRDVQKHQPDLLVIMLGTNDLFYSSEAAADAVAGRMEKMIRYARENHLASKILLLSCPHVMIPDMQLVTVLEKISGKYRELAEREQIRFADAFRWNIPMAFDGVHFTEEGHRIFAEKMYSLLQDPEESFSQEKSC